MDLGRQILPGLTSGIASVILLFKLIKHMFDTCLTSESKHGNISQLDIHSFLFIFNKGDLTKQN